MTRSRINGVSETDKFEDRDPVTDTAEKNYAIRRRDYAISRADYGAAGRWRQNLRPP